jgi:hypothetical protein
LIVITVHIFFHFIVLKRISPASGQKLGEFEGKIFTRAEGAESGANAPQNQWAALRAAHEKVGQFSVNFLKV